VEKSVEGFKCSHETLETKNKNFDDENNKRAEKNFGVIYDGLRKLLHA